MSTEPDVTRTCQCACMSMHCQYACMSVYMDTPGNIYVRCTHSVMSTEPDDSPSDFTNYGTQTVHLGAPGRVLVTTTQGKRTVRTHTHARTRARAHTYTHRHKLRFLFLRRRRHLCCYRHISTLCMLPWRNARLCSDETMMAPLSSPARKPLTPRSTICMYVCVYVCVFVYVYVCISRVCMSSYTQVVHTRLSQAALSQPL